VKRVEHSIVLLCVPLIGSCLGGSGPRFVAIDPEYAYVDGCTDVLLRGHRLGTSATASIHTADGSASAEISALTAPEANPDLPDSAQDVGFMYTGVTPASPTGESGYFDVSMTVDGQTVTLKDGFYYIACPEAVHVDTVELPEVPAAGQEIGFVGCGLAADTTVRYLSAVDGSVIATSAIESTCGTAKTKTAIPALPEGTYWIQLASSAGTWGDWCPSDDSVVDTGTSTDTDASDTDASDTDTSTVDTDASTDTDAAPDTDVTDSDLSSDSDVSTSDSGSGASADTADTGGDPCASFVSFTIGGE